MGKGWIAAAPLALLLAGFAPQAAAPAWQQLTTGTTASLRGLSAASSKVIWASGTRGTWLKSSDGGEHWTTGQVAGAERMDFRDVKAFSDSTAYLLAIAGGGGIYKTTDGGASWTKQYSDPGTPGFFLDCMAFWDADHGLAIGDPSGGHFLLLHTEDGGAHWTPAAQPPAALAGDGIFAASGTTLIARGAKEAWFGTGGTSGARVFHSVDGGVSWTATPVAALSPATPASGAGIFSLVFWGTKLGAAVGGDYSKPTQATNNLAITRDGGATWTGTAGPPPRGYRSAVAAATTTLGMTLIAVGTSGSDWSNDGGQSWTALGEEGFNSVVFTDNRTAFAADGHGHIAKLILP